MISSAGTPSQTAISLKHSASVGQESWKKVFFDPEKSIFEPYQSRYSRAASRASDVISAQPGTMIIFDLSGLLSQNMNSDKLEKKSFFIKIEFSGLYEKYRTGKESRVED
jgi:hypothetical protein